MRSDNGKPPAAVRGDLKRAHSIFLAISLITACSGAPPQTATAQDVGSLGQLDRSLRTLSENVNEAVVQVVARGLSPGALGPDNADTTAGRQVGSGVFVSKEGLLITNAHVVVGASRIEVVVSADRSEQKARRSILGSPPKSYPARIVGIDLETDLALLKIDAVTTPFLRFGDSDHLALGQVVLAFGSPLGLGGSVSMGVVSARARQLGPESPMVFIQTDAAINPGSSGGPLVDLRGRVVGINTLIVTRSGGNDGLGFAIPSNIVRTVYDQLRDDGVVTRGVIGAVAQTITPELAQALNLPQSWGVVLSDVLPGSPAEAAGLEPGDIIVSLKDKLMENARQFNVNVYRYRVGDRIQLRVRRGADERTVQVPVVERPDVLARLILSAKPDENRVARLNIVAFDLTPDIAQFVPGLRNPKGVLVGRVAAGSPLAAGDIILRINNTPTGDLSRLKSVLSRIPERDPVVATVERASLIQYVVLEN